MLGVLGDLVEGRTDMTCDVGDGRLRGVIPTPMPRHTAEFDDGELRAVRDLLELAFDGDVSDDDWEHSLGGLHTVVVDGGVPVAHASLVQRRLLHGGRALRAGYVEAVAVHPAHRRRGLAGAVMAPLERAIRRGYRLGALGSSDMAVPFYAGRGWQVWRGPLRVLTPSGLADTPEEQGGIFVLPGDVPLDLDAPLACDWRDGDVW